jgi:hypothetical protein
MNPYQPIETAPKDGTAILVVDGNASEPITGVAHWFKGEWRGGHAREWEMYPHPDETLGFYPSPTHWHEIPVYLKDVT